VPNQKRARQKAARRQKLEAQRRAAKRNQLMRRTVIVAIVAAVVIGSSIALFANSGGKSPSSTSTTGSVSTVSSTTTTTTPSATVTAEQHAADTAAINAGCPASTATRVNTLTWKTAPAMTINRSTTYYAHVQTTVGPIVIKLLTSQAPITVNNFVFLAEHHFYNCVIFHRVVPGFVIQGGDPTGTGTGGPGYTIADEYPKVGHPTYPLYSVAMANTGSAHTGGSQFFIVTGTSGEELPNSYSLFGQVVSGLATVKTIDNEGSAAGVPPTVTQRMLKVTISTKA
jgi:cyclophilin family peptidyl-prolyl cis-trans isomerase